MARRRPRPPRPTGGNRPSMGNRPNVNTPPRVPVPTPATAPAPEPSPEPAPAPEPASTPPASETPVDTPTGAYSALQDAENAFYAITGIRGIGQWAFNLSNQGYSADEIIMRLRYGTDETPEGQAAYQKYLQAYPGMDVFLGANSPISLGINPEQTYNAYRDSVREAARAYGVDPLLTSNEKISDYMRTGLSYQRIVNRMQTAASAVASTPPETLAFMRDNYGLTNGDLMSFYLDTQQMEEILQKRYTAAQFGGAAARQNIGVTAQYAESLVERGLTEGQAEQGFQTVAAQQGLREGFGETATQEELLGAAFGDVEAQRKVQRTAAARTGRFQGGGQFAGGQEGVSGLGSAAR